MLALNYAGQWEFGGCMPAGSRRPGRSRVLEHAARRAAPRLGRRRLGRGAEAGLPVDHEALPFFSARARRLRPRGASRCSGAGHVNPSLARCGAGQSRERRAFGRWLVSLRHQRQRRRRGQGRQRLHLAHFNRWPDAGARMGEGLDGPKAIMRGRRCALHVADIDQLVMVDACHRRYPAHRRHCPARAS